MIFCLDANGYLALVSDPWSDCAMRMNWSQGCSGQALVLPLAILLNLGHLLLPCMLIAILHATANWGRVIPLVISAFITFCNGIQYYSQYFYAHMYQLVNKFLYSLIPNSPSPWGVWGCSDFVGDDVFNLLAGFINYFLHGFHTQHFGESEDQ